MNTFTNTDAPSSGLVAILHYTELLSLSAFTNYARNTFSGKGGRVFTKEELSKYDGKQQHRLQSPAPLTQQSYVQARTPRCPSCSQCADECTM